LASILQAILKPKAFPQDAMGFETALQDWELLTSRWESMAIDTLNGAVRRQLLLEQTPANIRVQLTLSGPDSYEGLRSAVLNYMVNAKDWSSQHVGDAMEVDALTKGKGKGKDKDKKGKGKTVTCWTCGKEGHISRDCPSKTGDKASIHEV